MTLTGFTPGSTNTISVTADPIHPAPDLDWIEVVDVNSSVPSTGLCQPALWNVTTSISGAIGLPAIVDGILTNRFTSNRAMQVGDYVQIDFTGNVNLSRITLDNSSDGATSDFPGTYAVYSSQDGVTFSSTPFATGPGTASSTVISFSPESVRAVRIQVTSALSSNWWSIGELGTDCSL